jgi:hypothetical protein
MITKKRGKVKRYKSNFQFSVINITHLNVRLGETFISARTLTPGVFIELSKGELTI